MFLNLVTSQSIIFGMICLLFGLMEEGVCLTLIKSGNSCNTIEAKPFKKKKLNLQAMEKSCVARSGECFSKCRGNLQCRSFGIGKVNECSGSLQCLLYSQTILDRDYHIKDDKYDYYIMEPPTCCDEPCSNNKVCHQENCKCGCPEGYASYKCMCPRQNLSKAFNINTHVMLPGVMKQVDSGEQTWGIKEDQSLWALVNDVWIDQNDKFNHVSSGKAGVWGIDDGNDVFVRKGINSQTPFGTNWENIPFPYQKLVQIDAGSSGVVYGVNGANEIYCRANITTQSPYGSSWVKVPSTAKHISCSDYGCWAVRPDGTVGFREGVTVENCTGTGWVEKSGDIIQLDSGLTGNVYAITTNHTLHRIGGICKKLPMGNKRWNEVLTDTFKHVTAGNTHLYAISGNGTVFKFSV